MSNCSVCPHCGNCLRDPPPPAIQPSDLVSVSQEVHRLKTLINQLTAKRVALLQRLNQDRSSTGILPSEILSTIFEYVCPPIDFTTRPFRADDLEIHPLSLRGSGVQEDLGHRYFPLILGAVSSRWRHIAWSTPALWTTMALEIWPGVVKTRNAISILRLYMQNAAALPCAIELDFRKQQKLGISQGAELPLEPIRELIFVTHSNKIRTLRLSAPPPEWLSPPFTGLAMLEEVSLGWPLPSPVQPHEDMSLEAITTLRRLTIQNMVTDLSVRLFWPAITVLNLCNVRYSTCVELLLRSPNLVSFHSFAPLYSNATASELWLREPITLTHLKDFGWTCQTVQNNTNGWDEGLFRYLHLPSLRQLSLSKLYSGSDMELELAFLSRLPSTLSSLEIDTLYHTAPDGNIFQDVFDIAPQLSRLTLSNSCTGLLTAAILSLTPSSDTDQVRLPGLQNFRCRNVRNHCRVFDGSETCEFNADQFRKMLELRMNRGSNTSLLVEIFDGCETVWDVGAKERIAELVREGLALEILEDSQAVDWLSVNSLEGDVLMNAHG